jgi:NAD(P)-dependent dehydrogenase (short-subunit alcohol dehydrogenase family)
MKLWGQEPVGVTDVGEPEEIAGLVSYLVSKEARYVTGALDI